MTYRHASTSFITLPSHAPLPSQFFKPSSRFRTLTVGVTTLQLACLLTHDGLTRWSHLSSLAVRIAFCANCQSSRPRLLRFRGWGRRFSRPDFLELGGFSLATLSSDIATYLPTLGPRPFSPSLLSPNICPYAVWGKARREVRSRRSSITARALATRCSTTSVGSRPSFATR